MRCAYFTLIMILVLVLIIVFTYQGMNAEKKTIIETIMSQKSSKADPTSIENRVESIIYVMYELAVNPVRNTNDENTMYNIWYSTMIKRGLPDTYANPELFSELKGLIDRSEFSPVIVEKVIKPYYDSEKRPIGEGVAFPFRPVCLNY